MGQSQSKKYNQMHNSQSFLKQRKNIQINNWVVSQNFQDQSSLKNQFMTMKNQITKQIAQVYILRFQSKKTLQNYLYEFDVWRSKNKPNVIQSKYILIDKNYFKTDFLNFCDSQIYVVKLFLQNILITLNQIKDIPIAQSLYIFLSALNGFENLFNDFGYFSIKEAMIGLNQEGIIKVWMNTNYSLNRPLRQANITMQQSKPQDQNRFINQLFQIIQKNTDYQGREQTFKNYLIKKLPPHSTKGLTFANCKKLILNYTQTNQIDLPENLSSILDILFDRTVKTTQQSNQNISSNNNHVLYGRNYKNEYLLEESQDNNEQSRHNKVQYSNNGSVDIKNQTSQSHFKKLYSDNNNFNSSHLPKNNSQYGSQINIPKPAFPYENQTPRNNSSPPASPLKKNSYQQGFHQSSSNNNQFSDFKLQTGNQNTNSMPKMTLSYTYEAQKYHNQNKIPQNNNQNYLINFENPYRSLVQKQNYQRQSTIRQQAEQDSFFASYRNSKFLASNKPGSIPQKNRNTKNSPAHKHTGSSHSDRKLGLNQQEQISKLKKYSNYLQIQQYDLSHKRQNSYSQKSQKSQKSVVFHTLNEIKQIDNQIAQDLHQLMTTINA